MTAAEILVRGCVCSLPTDLTLIASAFGIKLVDFSACERRFQESHEELYGRLGLSFRTEEGEYVCAVNEKICHTPRRFWTQAHEMAHILLGHLELPPDPRQERDADALAADLLAPLTVLHFCGVSSAAEIERLCGISAQAAKIRFRQLTELRRTQAELYRQAAVRPSAAARDLFLGGAYEPQLFARFSPFISRHIAERSRHDNYEHHLLRQCAETRLN